MLSEKVMATGHETRNAGRHWQAGEQKKRRKLNVACYTETYLFYRSCGNGRSEEKQLCREAHCGNWRWSLRMQVHKLWITEA
jgi:hypothetical protein